MAKTYYSYAFNLDDGLIREEVLVGTKPSPRQVAGLEFPLAFDDYIDAWRSTCFPIFENPGDEFKLSLKFFREALARGENTIQIALEHNPLKNTYAAKNTLVHIELFEDGATGKARANVMWQNNPAFEKEEAF